MARSPPGYFCMVMNTGNTRGWPTLYVIAGLTDGHGLIHFQTIIVSEGQELPIARLLAVGAICLSGGSGSLLELHPDPEYQGTPHFLFRMILRCEC